MIRTLIAALALATPALAQTPPGARAATEAELNTFISNYVKAFNKGDAPALAREFYAAAPDLEARLKTQFEKLRAEEFGKLDLFKTANCITGAGQADVQMDFAYQYTYGGQMPPGDQTTVFSVAKGPEGWRIKSSRDLAYGQKMACPL